MGYIVVVSQGLEGKFVRVWKFLFRGGDVYILLSMAYS